ncbi:GDSL-type esterase/lipase family protein [Kineosporia rhizophila]|uniref:GDSL-type esterase/lipase family protein n=1 Tax=Kineosporia TaxID=49184 RepID=UPI001E5BD7A6|nr:GDSL-type esterase/lipase family protein [Kineosporia sp. NBRC 101677]MCE0539636.1 GDSL-type esterase/lipase family protein [Kineosporia rhizophila]GLY17937.1 lysophospholipase [Kineosporia sp. NBRC 101677]
MSRSRSAGPGPGEKQVRICVVGDALVSGVGDPKALGWVGRVAARTPQDEIALSVYTLGVPGENTADLGARWWEEASRRYGEDPGEKRVVIGLGRSDIEAGLSIPRSRLNLANMLDDAHARRLPAFVVGPPPASDNALNHRIEELSATFGDVCRRRGVPFVDCFDPLYAHEDWLTDLAAGDGEHPRQAGYGLIAWLVLHNGWYEWLGVPRP